MTEQEYRDLTAALRMMPFSDKYKDPDKDWFDNEVEVGAFRRRVTPDGDFIYVADLEGSGTYVVMLDEEIGNPDSAVWCYISEHPLYLFLAWRPVSGRPVPFREIVAWNKSRPYQLYRHCLLRLSLALRAFWEALAW